MNRRSYRNFFIHPSYQLRFILALTLPGILLIVGYSMIMYSHVRENYELLIELSPMTAEAKNQLYMELDTMIMKLAGASITFLGAVAGLALVLSHRTVGPLFHFKRIFEEIREGDTKARVRLRPRDEFRDVADSFNGMMDQHFGEKNRKAS
jgi:methyl-accepting chemotaxis protein